MGGRKGTWEREKGGKERERKEGRREGEGGRGRKGEGREERGEKEGAMPVFSCLALVPPQNNAFIVCDCENAVVGCSTSKC